MKKIPLAIAIAFTALLSCSKETNKNAIVVRDCTGTYINMDGKDYQVCNLEKAASFQNGTTVTVSFKKLSECNGSAKDAIVCMMLHPSEGWVEILHIK